MTLENGEKEEEQAHDDSDCHGSVEDPLMDAVDDDPQEGEDDGQFGDDAGDYIEDLAEPPALQ